MSPSPAHAQRLVAAPDRCQSTAVNRAPDPVAVSTVWGSGARTSCTRTVPSDTAQATKVSHGGACDAGSASASAKGDTSKTKQSPSRFAAPRPEPS